SLAGVIPSAECYRPLRRRGAEDNGESREHPGASRSDGRQDPPAFARGRCCERTPHCPSSLISIPSTDRRSVRPEVFGEENSANKYSPPERRPGSTPPPVHGWVGRAAR